VTPRLIELARKLDIPLVATQDAHYTTHDDTQTHEILLSIQSGDNLQTAGRWSLSDCELWIASTEEMQAKFADTPDALENSAKIADRCNVELELGKHKMPKFPLPEGVDDNVYMRELCEKGLIDRYGENPSQGLRDRLEYELGVITKMGYASYFLIVQDYINWAKNNGIIVGPGRGSAAGSIVAYTLKITNIDPIKYNLLFERFLNPERAAMPDIDVDFDDARRSDVFEYVREKYGRDHFAQIITFGTMAARGSVRDAGRALGYPYELCDKIAKLVPFNPNQAKKKGQLESAIEEVPEFKQLYSTNSDAKRIVDAAIRLEGVARHCSTHACAVVIAPAPLTDFLPLQKGTHEGDIITQYEMHAVEDIGLLKMDFLGLSNLTTIEKALKLIKRNHGVDIKIDTIPLDDTRTYKLLQRAESTGVFQLESAGMKRYLKELKPTHFEDIIAMVALYRPGPIDLIPQFISRKHGKEPITYVHPIMEKILSATYGVIVYQEQVMDMATEFAKLSKGEGYLLIKAVGKKIKALLDEQKERFVNGSVGNNIPREIVEKVWEQIEPFARYGFNKAHSACYAYIGYQTAYLKANYPIEFMAALLNGSSDDIERIAFLIEECRTMDIDVLAPEMNESMEDFAVVTEGENKGKIRFGLAAIKNVGENIVKEIIKEREAHGRFASIENLVTRVQNRDMNKKSLESLIRCGATDTLGERARLLGNVDKLLEYSREQQKLNAAKQVSLFDGFAGGTVSAPTLKLTDTEPARKMDKLMWEKELLGLFISDHPLREYMSRINDTDITQIKDLGDSKKKTGIKIAGMVVKVQKILTKTGKPMLFTMLEDMGSKIEVVVFPSVYEQNLAAFNENNIIVVNGKIDNSSGTPKLLAENVRPIATLAA
jgi:DNA polymerase-3 subunit alpha